jgi:hypothetical protein
MGKHLKKEISMRYLHTIWDSDPPSALHCVIPYSSKGSGCGLGLYLPLKDKINPPLINISKRTEGAGGRSEWVGNTACFWQLKASRLSMIFLALLFLAWSVPTPTIPYIFDPKHPLTTSVWRWFRLSFCTTFSALHNSARNYATRFSMFFSF